MKEYVLLMEGAPSKEDMEPFSAELKGAYRVSIKKWKPGGAESRFGRYVDVECTAFVFPCPPWLSNPLPMPGGPRVDVTHLYQ